MCRSPRGKSSRANNCQQARIVKNLDNQKYLRTAGSGVGGFSPEYFQNCEPSVTSRRPTISSSSSSSSSLSSVDLIIETEEVDIIQDYSYDVSYGLENDDEEYDDTLSEEF